MLTLMPPLRAMLQRLVIAILVFLDQTLKADVTPHLIAQLITLKQKNQPRHASVAIAERVNTEKIQIKRRHRNQRMHPTIVETMLPIGNQPSHSWRSTSRRNRAETHPFASIRIALDDVAVFFLVLPRIPDFATRQP